MFIKMFGICISLLSAYLSLAIAWDAQPNGYQIILGPSTPDEMTEWLHNWNIWKKLELQSVQYDYDGNCNAYNRPEMQWTRSNFVQLFIMMHDRAIYNRETKEYTINEYIKTMESRVGKIDSVLLWPHYPNSGIDNRNQWDFMRDVPGGLEGLRTVIKQFQEQKIKVLLPYNPWDTGTRPEQEALEKSKYVRMYSADILTLNDIINATKADGFNGDTMYGVPKSFYKCSENSWSRPLVASPEGGVPAAYLSHNPLSWGYFTTPRYSAPPVSKVLFLERRHMVQICNRWSLDKIQELQTAFFNGAGYVVWENIWGIWNGNTELEDEAIKRVYKLLRKFTQVVSENNDWNQKYSNDEFIEWQPYAYFSSTNNVYASEFRNLKHNYLFYPFINTDPITDSIVQFQVPTKLLKEGMDIYVYDVYHGKQLETHPTTNGDKIDSLYINITIEKHGFGALLVTNDNISTAESQYGLRSFLSEMDIMTRKPLNEFSSMRNLQQQKMEPESLRLKANINKRDNPMVYVHGREKWWFNVTGVQIEPVAEWTPNSEQYGTGVQFPWEKRPSNNHSSNFRMSDFKIDVKLVSNQDFDFFLKKSGYQPSELQNFLRHWENRKDIQTGKWNPLESWKIPLVLQKEPVVYISRADVLAYLDFYGLRLPHDWEWQYVASSVEQNEGGSSSRNLNSLQTSSLINLKVEDLVGKIWQMTDYFCDEHTCGQLLRGGSSYHPVASTLSDPNWYFPQAYSSNTHNRFLTLSDEYDRSENIGFRCAQSIKTNHFIVDNIN